jgi:hypothetical protein
MVIQLKEGNGTNPIIFKRLSRGWDSMILTSSYSKCACQRIVRPLNVLRQVLCSPKEWTRYFSAG